MADSSETMDDSYAGQQQKLSSNEKRFCKSLRLKFTDFAQTRDELLAALDEHGAFPRASASKYSKVVSKYDVGKIFDYMVMNDYIPQK
jgi:hypothetical protein